MTSQLFPLRKFDKVIYHCVDEIKAQPGMPVQEIEQFESALIRIADICYVTSEELLASRSKINANTHYFPNVADFSHFSKALEPSTRVPEDIARITQPIVGFVGAISAYKIDFSLLTQMAKQHPEWSIVLIGKVGEGDPLTNIAGLESIKNLKFLGPRDYRDLPGYLKAFSVAIIPSTLNEYTRNMFPMKFFEYLAAGIPVVATDLHALRGYGDYACLATGHASFIAGVEAALRGEVTSLDRRLELAREQTYERRTEKMLRLLSRFD